MKILQKYKNISFNQNRFYFVKNNIVTEKEININEQIIRTL